MISSKKHIFVNTLRYTKNRLTLDGIYLIIDDSNSHCGITDRLKTAIGLCYVAQQNGINFKFIHHAGFDMRDFLLPNKIDWAADFSDITRLPWKKRHITYFPPFTDFPKFKKGIQYICKEYIGKNLIEMTGVQDWQRVWRELFWDMFKPSPKVLDALSQIVVPEQYAVVNVRFINALGQMEDADYNAPFPKEVQEHIIQSVLDKIAECKRDSNVPIIVYSDSVRFLRIAEERGYQICDPDGVGHIMNAETGDKVNLMTFVYMLQMSKAEKVYSILNLEGLPSNSLYKSQYPRYAAIIGNKTFIRL